MISPFGPIGSNCLIPSPKRLPIPAAMITNVVFFIAHSFPKDQLSRSLVPSNKFIRQTFFPSPLFAGLDSQDHHNIFFCLRLTFQSNHTYYQYMQYFLLHHRETFLYFAYKPLTAHIIFSVSATPTLWLTAHFFRIHMNILKFKIQKPILLFIGRHMITGLALAVAIPHGNMLHI